MAEKAIVSREHPDNICDFLRLMVRQVEAPEYLSFEQNGLTRIAQFEPEPIGHLLQWFKGLKLSLDWSLWDLELPKVHCSSYGHPWLSWNEGFEAGAKCTELPLPRKMESCPFSSPFGLDPDLGYGQVPAGSAQMSVILFDGQHTWALPEQLVIMGLNYVKANDSPRSEISPTGSNESKLDLITALAASEYDDSALIGSFAGADLSLEWGDTYKTQVVISTPGRLLGIIPGGQYSLHKKMAGKIVGIAGASSFGPDLHVDHLTGLGADIQEDRVTKLSLHKVIAGLRLDLP